MPRLRKKPPGPAFTDHDLPDAAEMYTFESDHLFWQSVSNAPYVEGCFVRLYPPAGLTPAQISTFKAWLLQDGGASAVKVMAQPTEAVPDAPAEVAAQPGRTIRQVVMGRAARTKGVRDQSALTDLLTTCMDKAGI